MLGKDHNLLLCNINSRFKRIKKNLELNGSNNFSLVYNKLLISYYQLYKTHLKDKDDMYLIRIYTKSKMFRWAVDTLRKRGDLPEDKFGKEQW